MNKDEIINKLKALPPAAKYGAAGFAAVFTLALVVGMSSSPAAPIAPAPVAPVGNAPAQGGVAAPASVGVGAVAPQTVSNAPPVSVAQVGQPGMVGAPAVGMARPAVALSPERIASLKQCAVETIATGSPLSGFTDIGSLDDCDSTMNISLKVQDKKLPATVMNVARDAAYISVQKRAYVYVPKAGQYTFTASATASSMKFSCDLYIDDTSAPVLHVDGSQSSFFSQVISASSVATVPLEAGYHNVVTKCYDERVAYAKPLVTEFAVRAEDEAAPRLMQGYVEKQGAQAPAPVPAPTANPVAAPAAAQSAAPVANAAVSAPTPVAPAPAAPAVQGVK